MAEMRAAGLLDLNMPSDFSIPDPLQPDLDEEPLEPGDALEIAPVIGMKNTPMSRLECTLPSASLV